jgi:succinoglycan biosynthesis transport protein ExoP
MTITQFFSILRARWIPALAVFLAIVVLTLLASLVWPKKYTAQASLVVDNKPDPVSSLIYPGMTSPAFMQTQVDILQSDRVAQRVVRNLKLADNPQIREQWQSATNGQGNIEVWLAETFQKNMDVKPSRESNVITVSYKAPDPRFAAGLANAFVQAYIDTTLEMRVNPAKQYSSFFDSRLKEARDGLEKAQAKLSAFQKEKGIIATDERLDVENGRLNELSSQLVALQAVSAESTSRQAQAQGASGDRIQDVLNNPLISSLKADLTRNEAKLQELGARYGDNHPQVVEAKANIAELRRRIDVEVRRVTGGVTVSNTINRQREAQIRAALETQRASVLRMKAVRDEGQVLARDVDNAQKNYDAVQTRLTQSSLESQTTQSNAYPLTQATPPSEPSSPRTYINLLLAVFVGALTGVAIAVLMEFADRRVRDLRDITTDLGLPIIGMLPNGNRRARLARRNTEAAEQRVLGHLPAPAAKGA